MCSREYSSRRKCRPSGSENSQKTSTPSSILTSRINDDSLARLIREPDKTKLYGSIKGFFPSHLNYMSWEKMVLQNDGGKLFVKVERGTKPKIKLNRNARKALVTIPCSHVANWPLLKEEMDNGVTIIVQRLEHQYKIIIQHVLDKKPSVCVYVNSVANEKNLKTCVKLIHTQMAHIGIAGPNLEVSGTVKAQKVTFESTFGALHTNAKLAARYVALNAQHIFIKPEAMYCCQTLKMWSRKVQVDGRIFPVYRDLAVLVDSALLHIGVDGMIGGFRFPLDGMVSKSSENTAEYLKLKLNGNLANYGKIFSKDCIDMEVDGNILSLEDDRLDSAGRGYTALKQIKGIASSGSSSLPTSSKLSKAIESQNPDTVAQLLEEGVDPNDVVVENSVRCTPKKMAGLKYRKMRVTERRNKFRENITVIQALMVTHDWRRGLIMSHSIMAKVDRDCEDCAQFRATKLELTTCGSAQCEGGSIWTCESVALHVGNDLVIEGQVKNQDFTVECNGEVRIQRDGIVSQKNSAKVICSKLTAYGIWCVGEQINVDASTALFSKDSYVEGEFIGIKVEKDCNHGGIWRTNNLELITNGVLKTMHDGRVLCDDTAKVFASGFNCLGVWKVTESFQINVKESMSFQSKSEITSSTLKIINKGCCVFSGFIGVRHIQAYVRNDLITTESGRSAIGVMGTVATGAFRNDGSWVSDHSLRLYVACFEQSEDAVIHAKDGLELAVYDNSITKSRGRIVASRCTFNINHKVRFDGYIRVSHMEVCLPYSNESQCIIGGQLEVMYGPLVVKGHSEISSSHSSSTGHPHPAFILEGQLRAEAVIAPFLAIRFAEASYALLSGMSSVVDMTPYKALLSAGALYTMRASFIDSSSADGFPEAILCASDWIHEGQIRFRGSKAYLISNRFVNRGRLTNEGRLQNHMHSVYVSVMKRFENESVFSADEIYISGIGELENKSRIFATDTMQIKLPNFLKESAQDFENTKLLSAGKEWSKVSGQINGRGKIDIPPQKLVMEIKNLDFRNQIRLRALAQLHVVNDIIDEKARVSLSARDAVIFGNCKVVTESIEIKIGDAYETEVVLPENSSLISNHLRISGRCKLLTFVVDGTVECDSVIFDCDVKNVKLLGKGTLVSKNSLNFDGKSVTISLSEMHASEILGSSVQISPKGFAKLLPVKDTTVTTIYADSCTIDGKVFTEGKLNLKSANGVVRIDADLIGAALMSEVSIEGNDVILVGNISNLEFLEIYARRRFEYCETAMIENTKNIAIEAETVAFDGKLRWFDTIIITAEEAIIEGGILNKGCGSASVFGRNIRFEGAIVGLSGVEFSGRADTYIAGNLSKIGNFDVDSKWIYCKSDISSCNKLKLAGYSIVLDGNINSELITVNALGVILVYTTIGSKQCFLTGAFIIALNNAPSVPMDTEVSALIYMTDSYLDLKDTKKVYTKILFSPNVEHCTGSKEHWENAINIFKRSFQSVDEEFMTAALSYQNELQASNYLFPLSSDFCTKMKTLVDRFRIEHISIFNSFELLDLMQQQIEMFDGCRCAEEQWSVANFESNQLAEKMNDLKMQLLKYASQSPQSSIDDYGYGSRSSSEDNDDKTSFRASPTISVTKCDDQSGLSPPANATSEQPYTEFSGYNQYLSVPYSVSASNDGSSTDRDGDDSEREDEMNYVVNGERKIPIVRIDFEGFDITISKPRFEIPRQPTPTADLALKKLQVKTTMSTLDLRSFGSESSLASFSTAEYVAPIKIARLPLRRSMIPRSSVRKATAVV